jgi:hypothetical protein
MFPVYAVSILTGSIPLNAMDDNMWSMEEALNAPKPYPS